MLLYSSQFAPNPRKVLIYLAEKGITIPIEQVNLMAAEHRADTFREKNPMMSVPVLQLDDGRCFSESLAIIEYLEELHPSPNMLGDTAEQRMKVRMIERICELGVLGNVNRYLSNSHPFWKHRQEQVPASAALGMRYIHGSLKAIDHHIGDNTFLAGDKVSIADCTLCATLQFAKAMDMDIDLAKRANVARWLKSFTQRKSTQV